MKHSHSIEPMQPRVWEIDALRGFLILSVLVNHLNITINAFCINGYYMIDSSKWAALTDPLGVWYYTNAEGVLQSAKWVTWIREYLTNPAVDTFFIISGIACIFTRNGRKNIIKLFIAALLVAAFTYGLSLWTGDPTRFIRFGVLMCYAFCHLIYEFLLKKRSNEFLFIIASVSFAIGYYIRYHGVAAMRFPIFYILGVPQIGDQSSDFWPIFPMLGWFLLGVVIGRKYYSEKKTRLPYKIPDKLTKPLQFLGRYSGIIYVSHIVIYTAVFCGIGYIFHLL